jgi:hypothetical protein
MKTVQILESSIVVEYSDDQVHPMKTGPIERGLDEDVDNDGQIVFYSGLYRWNDGTIHEVPESD